MVWQFVRSYCLKLYFVSSNDCETNTYWFSTKCASDSLKSYGCTGLWKQLNTKLILLMVYLSICVFHITDTSCYQKPHHKTLLHPHFTGTFFDFGKNLCFKNVANKMYSVQHAVRYLITPEHSKHLNLMPMNAVLHTNSEHFNNNKNKTKQL